LIFCVLSFKIALSLYQVLPEVALETKKLAVSLDKIGAAGTSKTVTVNFVLKLSQPVVALT